MADRLGWSDDANEAAEWIVHAVCTASGNEPWSVEFESFNRGDSNVSRAYKFLAMQIRRLQGEVEPPPKRHHKRRNDFA